MDQIATYLAAIRSAYPDFAIREARLHEGEGQFNDILVINDSHIFRFSRYASQAPRLAQEVALLRYLQGRLPLPVPDPLFAHFEPPQPGQVFMGYAMLSGKPLWRETMHALDPAGLPGIAAQLAGFLQALHTLPVDGPGLDLPVAGGRAGWEQLYADIRQHLYPHMRPAARLEVSAHFERYLDEPRLHAFQPALRHGDFGGSNILHDPQSLAITGIIDFGFAGPGDPAADIAAVFTYGEPFNSVFRTCYPGIETLEERARFYRGTFALQEALHGVIVGDREAFENGMETYV